MRRNFSRGITHEHVAQNLRTARQGAPLLELGEHAKVVQERLGHSTITTTMNIYSHVTPTMQKAAADRFAAHLGGA